MTVVLLAVANLSPQGHAGNLASGEMGGPGWYLIHLHVTPNSSLDLWITNVHDGRYSEVLAWMTVGERTHGDLAISFREGGLLNDSEVRSDVAPGLRAGFDLPPERHDTDVGGQLLRCDPCVEQDVDLVILAGNSITNWDWALSGSGTTVNGIESGTSVFFAHPSQFRDVLHVHAHTSQIFTNTAGATVGGTLTVQNTGRLVGIYDPYEAAGYVVTPTDLVDCNVNPCFFTETTGPNVLGPGQYTFVATGAADDRGFVLGAVLPPA